MLVAELLVLLTAFTVLCSWRRAARQTSLLGTWVWAFVAISCIAAGSAAGCCFTASALDACRLITDTAILCPTVSLFGARRPQHRGWNFVAITFWGMLALPALETVFALRGEMVQLSTARWLFLWIVIGAGWMNHLFTRFAFPSTLFAMSQVLLLGSYLFNTEITSHDRLAAITLLATAAVAAALVARRRRRQRGWDRVWLDFRDLFGAIWALRLRDRFNAAARISGWETNLTWSGFEAQPGEPHATHAHWDGAEICLRAYLRRFVSTEWIDLRVGP